MNEPAKPQDEPANLDKLLLDKALQRINAVLAKPLDKNGLKMACRAYGIDVRICLVGNNKGAYITGYDYNVLVTKLLAAQSHKPRLKVDTASK